MISYREKQLLATMKYLQNETYELSKQMHEAISASEKNESYIFNFMKTHPADNYANLVEMASEAGYDCYIRADDILAREEIADLECRKDEIDKNFRSLTKLQDKDIPLLLLAIGLQVSRWAIITTLKPLCLDYKADLTPREKRLTDKEGEKFAQNITELKDAGENSARKAYEKKEKLVEKYDIKKSFAKMNYTDEEYRTVEQILFRPVPYDAERSNNQDEFQKLLKQKISGTNHRAYTLGHDPILGWVIGPINILTRSVTFKNPPLVTFPVQERGNIITLPKSSIIYEIQVALDSVQDDSSRLAAAIAKQALHFASDKYTKGGLPIPFFSAEKAQKLIDKNWNSVEAEKWIKKAKHSFANDSTAIALQFFIAHYINELIRVIHIMLCEEDTDSNSEFFEVRTKRIISLSNVIASTSNVVYAIAKAYISQDPIKGVQVLDFGGIIESLRQVISNSIFISKIKDEYIKSKINEDFQNCLDKLEI